MKKAVAKRGSRGFPRWSDTAERKGGPWRETVVALHAQSRMYGGTFKGRQPESLQPDEWAEIVAFLLTGKADEWALG